MIEFITYTNSFSVLKIQFSVQKLNTWFSHLIRGRSWSKMFSSFWRLFDKQFSCLESPLSSPTFHFKFIIFVLIQIQCMYVTFRIVFPDFPIAKIITRERSKCRTVLAWLTLVGTRLSAQWRKKTNVSSSVTYLGGILTAYLAWGAAGVAAPRAWNYIKILGIVYETSESFYY